MIKGNEEIRNKVRKAIGLKENQKLILFAPTYRKPDDNYFKESIAISYGVDTERVVKAMQKRFGGEWVFAFRYHPAVTNRESFNLENVLDLTDYPDMQELLCASDAMINDFSSSMWDFMLSGKPSFLFAVDLDHYIKTTEVYTPVESWPFPKSVNNDELEKNILEFVNFVCYFIVTLDTIGVDYKNTARLQTVKTKVNPSVRLNVIDINKDEEGDEEEDYPQGNNLEAHLVLQEIDHIINNEKIIDIVKDGVEEKETYRNYKYEQLLLDKKYQD
jgi:CDP-glycerol glycerophosphotransferase (TagB/SpsB family)